MTTNPILPLGSTPDGDNFRILTARPDVRFLSQAVQPPSYVYVSSTDSLVAGCASSATGETVTVSYRLLRPDGQVILGQFTMAPANDRSIAVRTEPLSEGFLLSVSCKAAVAVTRGVTFARLFLSNPSLGAGQPSYMLMADYVTTAMAPAHPNGRVLAPSEGPGNSRIVFAAAVPVATEFLITCPTNARWRVLSGVGTFTTDAAVGTRAIVIAFSRGGNGIYEAMCAPLQGPSLNIVYSGGQAAQAVASQSFRGSFVVAPENILLGGDVIISGTSPLAGGDQWSTVQFLVEEHLDNV